ncbi:hypothetical protein QJU89_08665 [Pasteurella skyensis]|uniref:Uncharacterized protein n=1 Tax=Phocoenobacter skyensis TaxID=97481 RepID=A0AAJ6P1E6_9PAST|nr:hypothetical protein [Pasteurella skyensis]MDP8163067.1 hypothetical protein [Pasteurella skyensis]MDP8173553.1 hypothetical protein [Pasteurella skyensis]MDP8176295.1 hypothetical protein [Pasteurella skyensis]MDP8178994.1 hypothetical protein [Pasteurella skyensis]MDP8183764.1 hypothetical protein [Pasteurella skyensis]
MKDLFWLIIICILGFLGYQLIIEDKSINDVKYELKEKVSESKEYLAKEYLEYKISKLQSSDKSVDISYSGIKCFNDDTYSTSCSIKDLSMEDTYNKGYNKKVVFNLTIFGVDALMKYKVGAFDLNYSNIGIRIDNIIDLGVGDINFAFKDTQALFERLSKKINLSSLSLGLYLKYSKYTGENTLEFNIEEKDSTSSNPNYNSFLTSIKVNRDSNSEKMIKELSDCMLDRSCDNKTINIEGMFKHLYFKELNTKLYVDKSLLFSIFKQRQLDEYIAFLDNDDSLSYEVRKNLKQFFMGNLNRLENTISAKYNVSLFDIFNSGDSRYFLNKFNYELNGTSYVPYSN